MGVSSNQPVYIYVDNRPKKVYKYIDKNQLQGFLLGGQPFDSLFDF